MRRYGHGSAYCPAGQYGYARALLPAGQYAHVIGLRLLPCRAIRLRCAAVSYTHLTLPTN